MSFNPRICKRCDFAQSRLYHYRRVSIHASVKDATIKISAYPFRAYVSIHASVKDATCKGVNFFTSPYCFNPRICKRCDKDKESLIKYLSVSIHASVKDATMMAVVPDDLLCVSIHASVKDATAGSFQSSSLSSVSIHASVKDATDSQRPNISMTCFNPRICKRCDASKLAVRDHVSVSIHASVKDATTDKPEITGSSEVSIHASVKDATHPN